jgi:integrase
MSKAATESAPEQIPLGTRNPENANQVRVRCPSCGEDGEDRWAQVSADGKQVKESGWIKRCGVCAAKEIGQRNRKTWDKPLPCGSSIVGRDPNNPKILVIDCGICGEPHSKPIESYYARRKKRTPDGFCAGCDQWARLALKPKHYNGPSAERGAIYAKIKDIRRALEGGSKKAPGGRQMPFYFLAKKWDEDHPQTNDDSRSNQSYWVRLLTLYFYDLPIGEMAIEKAIAFREHLLIDEPRSGGKRSEFSVNKVLMALGRMYAYAVRRGWIKENPIPRGAPVAPHKLPAKSDRLMTLEEESRLLAACTGQLIYLRDMIIFMADTGMYERGRQRLSWANVDLEHRLIQGRGCPIVMTPRLFTAMQSLWERSDHNPQGQVWAQQEGKIKNDFRLKARRAAGIKGLQWGDLRRTAAWRMAEAGKSLEQLANVLGIDDLNAVDRLLKVNPAIAQCERISTEFQAFIKEQFGSASNGNGNKQVARPRGPAPRSVDKFLRDARAVVVEIYRELKSERDVTLPAATPRLQLLGHDLGEAGVRIKIKRKTGMTWEKFVKSVLKDCEQVSK